MFDEHGAFKVNAYRQVLIMELMGEFNELIGHRIVSEVEACIDEFMGKPFALLLIANDFGLGTPETDEIFKHSEIHSQSRGLTHSTLVYKLDAQLFQIGSNIIEHPEVIRFGTKSLDDALRFLNQAGYKLTKEEVEELGYSIT